MDGEIVAGNTEERITRRKHDPSFPEQSIRDCCDQAGISPSEIDLLAFFEDPILKLERIRRTVGHSDSFSKIVARWLSQDRFEPARRYGSVFGCKTPELFLTSHHRSHAASSFYCSPFESAAVVTIDGVGELETMTVWRGEGTELTKVTACQFPHSLGLFYSAFTSYLGFEVNEGEYKVMGMAGYGKPTLTEEILKQVSLHADGTFEIVGSWFNFSDISLPMYSRRMCEALGAPRAGDDERLDVKGFENRRSPSWTYADIAASVQAAIEFVLLHCVKSAMKMTGESNVCLAGGVALNGLANDRIQKELGCQLFIQPASGDSGCSMGAALDALVAHSGKSGPLFPGCYLGGEVGQGQIDQMAQFWPGKVKRFDTEDSLLENVAGRLARGEIVGWVQGRSEWGPRALGNRSILASPLTPEMKDVVNAKIKFREGFRPFAPSVSEAVAADYFDIESDLSSVAPERFMTTVTTVKQDKRDVIPAVTHVDGTARPQVVSEQQNARYHGLIERFGSKTGVPVLLNTSFNRRGEPIVETGHDALLTFRNTGLDALIINETLFEKS